MIFLFIIFSLAGALIHIPLHHELELSTKNFSINNPFSFRRLSSLETMENIENGQYSIQFEVGTPPQSFTATLSLRYSWIFIGQKNCSQCLSSTKKFDPSSSSTFQNDNKYLNYGLVEGYAGKDTISIVGLVAKSQGILSVSKESGIDNYRPDGFFGLGFSTTSDGNPSILSTLSIQHDISNMVFSLYFNDSNSFSDLPNYGESMLIIDGHYLNKYSKESAFTYIKVASTNGVWEMNLDSTNFDSVNYTSKGNTAIISSSTSYIQGPTDVINDIFARLRGDYSCFNGDDGQVYCDCKGSYPYFIIQMSGVKFTIKPEGYLLESDLNCLATFGYSSIANAWILGLPFLRRFYSIYDMENKQVGFATVGITSQISYNNFTNSNGSGSGSSGTNSTSRTNSTSGTNSTNSDGNSGSSGDNSGNNNSSSDGENSNSNESSDSSDDDWKLKLAIALPISVFFIVWISCLVVLVIKIRESRNIARERLILEELQKHNELEKLREAQIHNIDKNSSPKKSDALVAADPLTVCEKCKTRFPSRFLKRLPCDHYFCEGDLKQFLENNIKENFMERSMKCPLDDCPGKIDSLTIQSLVSPNLWDKFNNRSIINNLELKNCLNCNKEFDQSLLINGKCLNCRSQ